MFRNFGGIEFVPPAISVRTYGDKSAHTSAVSVNEARYNDFVPMVYGTAWYQPPVVFARNDGNLTRMEVLLGLGEIQGVLKVLVNDVEIPAGVYGTNMTGTGWYNIPTLGTRAAASTMTSWMAAASRREIRTAAWRIFRVVVPNRINDGTSLPKVTVLVQGLKLPVYGSDGQLQRRAVFEQPGVGPAGHPAAGGWSLAEIDVASFARRRRTAMNRLRRWICTETRFSCRDSNATWFCRNARARATWCAEFATAARLLLTYGARRRAATAGGEFDWRWRCRRSRHGPTARSRWTADGRATSSATAVTGFRAFCGSPTGEPSFRVYSRSMADTPNRFTVEFQDSLNEYQQDSFSLVDADDVARSGQEVSQTLAAVGIPNFDQAARILKLNLDRSVRGNTYVEFETSVKAFGIRPGDLITVTYLKEGLNRQAFRVLKIAPGHEPPDLHALRRRFMTIRGTPIATDK